LDQHHLNRTSRGKSNLHAFQPDVKRLIAEVWPKIAVFQLVHAIHATHENAANGHECEEQEFVYRLAQRPGMAPSMRNHVVGKENKKHEQHDDLQHQTGFRDGDAYIDLGQRR
jgi:hypothetical protein